MKRGIIQSWTILLSLSCGAIPARAAVLGTYTFTGADPAGDLAVPTGTNMTFGALTRANVTAASLNDQFASSAYTASTTIDLTEYAQFVLTAAAGFRLDLTSVSLKHTRNDQNSNRQGPLDGAIRADFEAYAAGSGTGSTFSPLTSQSTATWDFTDFSTAGGGSATFRIYGWNSPGSPSGSMQLRLDDVTINGELVALAKMTASAALSETGPVIVGHAVNVNASVSNVATGGTQIEGLNYTIGGTGGVGGGGNVTNLSPAGSPNPHALTINTATAGQKTGSVVVNNTNAYSINGNVGASQFTQNVTLDVLDHSDAAFDNTAGSHLTALITNGGDDLTIDFGVVLQNAGGGQLQSTFDILAQIATVGYTAALDLDLTQGSGDTAALLLAGLGAFADLAAGSSESYMAALDTTSLGVFSATYQFLLSDEDLPGATAAQSELLTLTLTGEVVAVPEPATLALLAAGCVLIARPRRRSGTAARAV